MKKMFGIIGKVILVIIIIAVLLIAFLLIRGAIEAQKPVVDADYQEKAETGGTIEAKYLADGAYETAYAEFESEAPMEKVEIWYPKELETSDRHYPVIVYCNGSGVKGSKITALMEHYASWGFIVLNSEDASTWSGESPDKMLSFLLEQNADQSSLFYGHVDTENIGITGHSQGGVGVFNAITVQSNSGLYKAAVPVSPTAQDLAEALNWPYDLTKVSIPVLMLAGDGEADANTVIPLEKMHRMYEQLDVSKVMARKHGIDHDLTDSDMDGYVIAGFMWQLQGDQDAAAAFTGESPEILSNPLYQDQKIDLH